MNVSADKYQEALDLYHLWKELNFRIKAFYSRGVNLPEAITEIVTCYVNGFTHSLGQGSEDAFTIDGAKVQIKATSNFNSDLTSFGPNSQFEFLHFARLDIEKDELYLYDIPVLELSNVMVNRNETFSDQQRLNRRPRFSIVDKYINRYDISHYAIVDLNNGRIIRN